MENPKCYLSYNKNRDESKVWYNQYKGFIVKSWIDPGSNRIFQEKIPYNQPDNFINFLNNYFTYKIN
jgi:hypothetical protein